MPLRYFALPDLGEGLTEASVLTWLVAPGDEVTLNQPIVEVETAKAAVEVPSPWSGVVRELFVEPGNTVLVGSRLISIATVDATDSPADSPADSAREGVQEAMLVGYGPRPERSRRRPRVVAAREPVPAAGSAAAGAVESPDVTVLAKPPVRKLARDLGVDLRTVRGSGPAGSITREDVDAVRKQVEAATGKRLPVTGTRKAMAAAMTRSAFTAPHATVFVTVDATETVRLREALSARREFADIPLTPLAIVAKAVAIAAGDAPLINAWWDEDADEILVHDRINLGIAVATPRGLVVPNVKDAGALSLVQLARAIAALTTTARDGHTRPAELTGGTMSITNIGVFGVDGGTPILNPGESAILCLGTIKPAPWVYDGQLAVRQVVQLSLSFDHRIIDGATASQFLADVGAMVTDPRLLLARA
jgi:pyruvate dehydrogenase E2 component (dihydrolipoamide acetyltransferase)